MPDTFGDIESVVWGNEVLDRVLLFSTQCVPPIDKRLAFRIIHLWDPVFSSPSGVLFLFYYGGRIAGFDATSFTMLVEEL